MFLSVHPLTDSSYFHIVAIVSSTAVNMGVHIIFQDTDFVSFGYTPRSEIAGCYDSSIFNLSIMFFTIFLLNFLATALRIIR